MPVAALIYDFDKTLTPRYMQEYALLPELNVSEDEFWRECRRFALRHNADGVLSYMYETLAYARGALRLDTDAFHRLGAQIDFYPGVEGWFKRVNAYGASFGLDVEHYIISSGMKELIDGTRIANEFKAIFAASFCYDENGEPFWPATAVNYTEKTQYLFRINKGILDVTNDDDLNDYTPEENRRIPFTNMIYIGDGLTDVPCMKMTKLKGGVSIAVHTSETAPAARALLRQRRADYAHPADYGEDGALSGTVYRLLREIYDKS